MWTTIAGIISALLYLTATVILGRRLANPQGSEGQERTWNGATAAAAVFLHTLVLYQNIVGESGLNLGFFNAVSLVSWVMVVLLLFAAISKPVENLGLLVLPVAALALVLSVSFQSNHFLPNNVGFGLETHIVLAIIAYSLLTIAALQSLLLAFQDYQLRHKHPGGIMHALPPLQTMEKLLFQMIRMGFFLLSLAIVSGMMFLEDMFAQKVAHKTVLSLIAWVIFAILLWGRFQFGWRGRVAIRWSIGGFVALMLAFFGSKLVLELILHR